MPIMPGFYQVEQLGHRVSIGYCEEVDALGGQLLRITIPALPADDSHEATEEAEAYIGIGALYQLTRISEARALAALHERRPRRHLSMLPAPIDSDDDSEEI